METISLNINGVCRELAVEELTLLKTLRTDSGSQEQNAAVRQGLAEPAYHRRCSHPPCLVKAVNLEGKAIETIEGLQTAASISTQSSRPLWMPEHRTVRFLHSRHDHVSQSPSGPEPDPRRRRSESAIDPNLCRCTGYDNIVKAILLASRMEETDNEYTVIGKPRPIGDAALKVTDRRYM